MKTMKNIFFTLSFIVASLMMLSCTSSNGELIYFDNKYQYTIGNHILLPLQFDVQVLLGLSSVDADSLNRYFYESLKQNTQSKWLSPKDLNTKVIKNNIEREFNELLTDYQRGGVPNIVEFIKFGEKLGVESISACKIRQEIKNRGVVNEYRFINIIFQTVSLKDRKVVVEVTSEANCGAAQHDIGALELIKIAFKEITRNYPGGFVY